MYSFGVNYQVTPSIDVNLAYTSVTGDTSATATSASNGSINGNANSVNMLGLTGRYAFSKRTQMYAGIGQANNSGAYFMSPIYGGVTMGGMTTGTGANIAAAMLGLRHSF
jgi:predicted porin